MKLAKWMREAPQGCFQMYSKDELQTFEKRKRIFAEVKKYLENWIKIADKARKVLS